MNLNRIARELQNKYGHLFEVKTENDQVTAKGNLTIKGHDDDVYTTIRIYSSGGAFLRFCFDKVAPTGHVLNLVNNLNDELFYLKAYIDEDNYLVLQHSTLYMPDMECIDYISRVLNEIVEEDTEKLLKPITKLTA